MDPTVLPQSVPPTVFLSLAFLTPMFVSFLNLFFVFGREESWIHFQISTVMKGIKRVPPMFFPTVKIHKGTPFPSIRCGDFRRL